MSIINAQLDLVRRAVTSAGAPFPQAVTKALAQRDEAAAAVTAYPTITADRVAEAVCAALLRGDDPADDERVRHLTTARAISSPAGGLAHNVVDAADRVLTAALTASADTIVEILRDAVAQDSAKLEAAFHLLGAVDLNDSQLILSMGPDAARAWAEARESSARIKTIDRAWTSLATLTGFASPSCPPTSRLADLDIETFEKVGRKAEPWAIVCAGATIDLADGATIRGRVDRINDERQRRQDSADRSAAQVASRALRIA